MTQEQINELRKLAQAATPGPWYAEGGTINKDVIYVYSEHSDFEVCHGDTSDSDYIAAANPAAILAMIAEIDSLRDEVNGLTGELESERKRLDWALKHDSFFDHTTGVFFCDPAFKIPQPQVRIETDNFRATIDELMGQP